MKQKIYEPARHNEESPAEGMAAVNTFNAEEAPIEEMIAEQSEEEKQKEKQKQKEGEMGDRQ